RPGTGRDRPPTEPRRCRRPDLARSDLTRRRAWPPPRSRWGRRPRAGPSPSPAVDLDDSRGRAGRTVRGPSSGGPGEARTSRPWARGRAGEAELEVAEARP